jgi:hypothetical protein
MAKAKPKIGRPTKLTKEIQQAIVVAIQSCNYTEVAAAYAGIDKATFYRWMERGESEPDGIYRDFRDAIRKAEAEAEVYATATLRKAMPDTPSAATWFLERKFQERWGRKEQVTTLHKFDHLAYLAGEDEPEKKP